MTDLSPIRSLAKQMVAVGTPGLTMNQSDRLKRSGTLPLSLGFVVIPGSV
jgi:hypothetical protein